MMDIDYREATGICQVRPSHVGDLVFQSAFLVTRGCPRQAAGVPFPGSRPEIDETQPRAFYPDLQFNHGTAAPKITAAWVNPPAPCPTKLRPDGIVDC